MEGSVGQRDESGLGDDDVVRSKGGTTMQDPTLLAFDCSLFTSSWEFLVPAKSTTVPRDACCFRCDLFRSTH
eukprot:765482-Hanusia_phi.AAC.1